MSHIYIELAQVLDKMGSRCKIVVPSRREMIGSRHRPLMNPDALELFGPRLLNAVHCHLEGKLYGLAGFSTVHFRILN